MARLWIAPFLLYNGMMSTVAVWQNRLLDLAHEASHSPVLAGADLSHGRELLRRAYKYCERLTAEHSRSFHLASRLLLAGKRRAVQSLYAFCRTTDDIVDRPRADAETALDAWRHCALDPDPSCDDLTAVAWADTRARYRVPLRYAEQLVEGVAQDISTSCYTTFEELITYCYGVAVTVGLMSLYIVGFTGSEALTYAIKLGVALQLTNILRDVGEGYRAGRVYLPQEELATFDLSGDDLAAGRVDDRWRAFMRFQIARTRQLCAKAWPGIAWIDRDGRLAIAAAADLYGAILDNIEARDYDVFRRRAHVGTWGKLRRLPRLWWRVRRLAPLSV
jgi:phytoene synthase